MYLIILLLAVPTLDSISGILLRTAPITNDWVQQLFFRLTLASVLSYIFFARDSSPNLLTKRDWIIIFLRILFGWILGVSFWVLACKETTLARAALFSSLPSAPLWAHSILSEKLSRTDILRVLIALCGVLIVSGNFYDMALIVNTLGAGDYYAMIAGILISFSATLSKMHRQQIPSISLTRITLVSSALFFGLWSLMRGSMIKSEVPLTDFMLLAASALQLIASSSLWFYLLRRCRLMVISNISALEPCISGVFGYILFAEPVHSHLILGGSLIVCSTLRFSVAPVEQMLRLFYPASFKPSLVKK